MRGRPQLRLYPSRRECSLGNPDHCNAAAGVRIGDDKIHAVQPCDGGNQRQAKASTRRIAALFQRGRNVADTASRSSRGMPGPVSLTSTPIPPRSRKGADRDAAAGRRELDGIVNQIPHCLEQQTGIARHDRGRYRRVARPRLTALLVCQRLVEFDHIGHDLREIDGCEAGPACPGFDLGNAQHGRKRPQDGLGLDDRSPRSLPRNRSGDRARRRARSSPASSRVRGVRRSCAILSQTPLTSCIRRSISSSMPLMTRIKPIEVTVYAMHR